MPPIRLFRVAIACLISLMAVSCASVQQEQMYSGYLLPRPEQIIVFDFAITPEDVKIDSGFTAKAMRSMSDTSEEKRQSDDARKLAKIVAKKLVALISEMGLPAIHEEDEAIDGASKNLLVRGTFISVDEGDRGERVAIGLGAGTSKVVIDVELTDWTAQGERVVDRFKVTAKSGKTPGMAETMGVGAVTGHLLVSAAVSTGVQTASEHFGSSIEADTSRAAKNAAETMKTFFIRQQWVK